jgi:hypothetical protein
MLKYKIGLMISVLGMLLAIFLVACNNTAPTIAPTATPRPTNTPSVNPQPATPTPPLNPTPTARGSDKSDRLGISPMPSRQRDFLIGDPEFVDVSTRTFLDDRSNPIQVVRSYYNAINRKELVRAYSYWSPNASPKPPTFEVFQKDFAAVTVTQLETGKTFNDKTGDTVYYYVPITAYTRQANNRLVTYVGCYTVAQPQAGAPPFVPLGIYSINLEEVQNYSSNLNNLMAQICQK